mgnify:CR=1 FL=1
MNDVLEGPPPSLKHECLCGGGGGGGQRGGVLDWGGGAFEVVRRILHKEVWGLGERAGTWHPLQCRVRR